MTLEFTEFSPSKIAVCTLLSEMRLVEALTTGALWLVPLDAVVLYDMEPVPIVALLEVEPIADELFAELVAPLAGVAERETPVPAAAPLLEGVVAEPAADGVGDQEPLGGV